MGTCQLLVRMLAWIKVCTAFCLRLLALVQEKKNEACGVADCTACTFSVHFSKHKASQIPSSHTPTQKGACMHTHAHTCTLMHPRTCTHKHTQTHPRARAHTHAHAHTRTQADCLHSWNIHMHTHTHTHTFASALSQPLQNTAYLHYRPSSNPARQGGAQASV